MKGALQEKKDMILMMKKMEALKVEREMLLLKDTIHHGEDDNSWEGISDPDDGAGDEKEMENANPQS